MGTSKGTLKVLCPQQKKVRSGHQNQQGGPDGEEVAGGEGALEKSLCSLYVGGGSYESPFNLPVPLPIPS